MLVCDFCKDQEKDALSCFLLLNRAEDDGEIITEEFDLCMNCEDNLKVAIEKGIKDASKGLEPEAA